MKNFNSNTEDKDEWLTPPWLVKALGQFDLDPCQPITPPWQNAWAGWNVKDNGLQKEWLGRIWCNPPYGKKTFFWLKKLAEHGNGIALIFARTETAGFHREVWDKADGIFFFEKRLTFHHVDGSKAKHGANAPSCLVAYGKTNVLAIEKARENGLIKGKLVCLKN